MPRLLLINPNTTAAITERLAERARALAPPGARVIARTAAFGRPYLSDEAGVAIAAHAVLDAWETTCAAGEAPHAVLIGCFGDPGLFALREVAGVPATGLAEAAMREAARDGRYAIVTGGAAWAPMLERLAFSLDLLGPLAAIETVAETGAQLAADPALARRVIGAAVGRAAAHPGVARVIVGGAGLAGLADALADEAPVPLIDSVDAGVRDAWARALAVARLLHQPLGGPAGAAVGPPTGPTPSNPIPMPAGPAPGASAGDPR